MNVLGKVAGYVVNIQKQLYSYKLAMNNVKTKLRNNSIHNSIKKNKILGKNLTKVV